MMCQSLAVRKVRELSAIEANGDEIEQLLTGLLQGNDEDFPGLLQLLSFGVPKSVEEHQVQSPTLQLAVWASKLMHLGEGFELGDWLVGSISVSIMQSIDSANRWPFTISLPGRRLRNSEKLHARRPGHAWTGIRC